jgi:hypothetical protein
MRVQSYKFLQYSTNYFLYNINLYLTCLQILFIEIVLLQKRRNKLKHWKMLRRLTLTHKLLHTKGVDVECMLDMSATGSLPGTEIGGESNGGMDADANFRNEWDEGLW